jgi:hypothetical protein
MGRIFGALAKTATGYRSGQNKREQMDLERETNERELARQAFEFDAVQRANSDWRKDQNARWDDDRRVRDETARAAREDKARVEHTNAIEQGWEDARPDAASAAQSAMSALSGGTGAATRGFDVERPEGVAAFQKEQDGVTYGGPSRVGAVQHGQIGGKRMTYDPQRKANATAEAAWQKAVAAQMDDKRMAARRDHEIRLQAGLREPRQGSQARPLTTNSRVKINREMVTSETAIRQIEDAIAATKGVKDYAGPIDDAVRKFRNGWGQGMMEPQPERDNAAGVYSSVVTPIITGEFGAALTETERKYISPHVAQLAEAREEQIPEILNRIKRALEQAREEQMYALEISGVETEGLERGAIPARPPMGTSANQAGKPKPRTGGGMPTASPTQAAGETKEQRIKRLAGRL